MPATQRQKPVLNLVPIISLTLIGILLAWLVITRSLGAWLAEDAPETALMLRSGDAAALLELAESKMIPKPKDTKALPANKDTQKLDEKQIMAWVKKSLRDQPLNPKALRILGQLADKRGDKVRAEKFMSIAVDLSVRESLAAFWLLQQSYQQKDFDKSLRYADILLWHRPKLAKHIAPVLAGLSENKNTRPQLVAILAQNPAWRKLFFEWLPRSMTNAQTPLNLFFGLKKTPFPPTKKELRNYLGFLNKKRLYDQSYYAWLQFLPEEQLAKTGHLFNGSFELPPDQIPFNWTIKRGNNVTTAMVPRPDNPTSRALNVKMSHGRVDFGNVHQTVVLSPGRYRLEVRYKGKLTGKRGLSWRIGCLGGKRSQIAKGPMFVGNQPNWKRISIPFTVPDQECDAQIVILTFDARIASEKLVSGEVWYDDLKIVPRFSEQGTTTKTDRFFTTQPTFSGHRNGALFQ